MTKKDFEVVEIYENILVYRNVFSDPQKMYDILKESSACEHNGLLGDWGQWSQFGQYISETIKGFHKEFKTENIRSLSTDNETQEDHKYFLLELSEGFDRVTEDYLSRYGESFDFNKDTKVVDAYGQPTPLWATYGPSICEYHRDMPDAMSMTYHSDFIREPIPSPGYKFAVTVNAYFNDDYEGGEIDFFVNGELIKYKPQAGDWLLFPSGHPEVLTKNGTVYLHGVFPSYGNKKYFSRMYWRKYSQGSQEWLDKEKEFGKEGWASMQNDILQEYVKTIPNRFEIEEGVRVR